MKALVNTSPGRLELREWPLPEPAPGQVRVRTLACGICATDLEMIDGWDRTGFPSVPGHEWSGVVEAVGDGVDPAWRGARCVAENVLSDGGEVGFEHPGGYAECFVTEADRLHRIPDTLSSAVAALIEPLAVAVRALRRLRLEDRSAGLICGDGPIGLLMLMLLRRAGVARIGMAGGRTQRLALARELGAAFTVNYHAAQNLGAALEAQGGGQFPTIVEASGSAAALKAGMAVAGMGAKLLVVGDYGGAVSDFAWNRLLHRELELIGSNASAGAWAEAVRLGSDPAFPLARLLTHQVPVVRFEEGMSLVRRRDPDAIKVVMEWRP